MAAIIYCRHCCYKESYLLQLLNKMNSRSRNELIEQELFCRNHLF